MMSNNIDELTENIASAAQTLQHIIQETRQRRDEQGFGVSASLAQVSALQLVQKKLGSLCTGR
jgi:hypothetical protein